MDILLSPDTLSLVGNINHIIISSVKDVSFTLKDHASGSIVIQHTYTPSRTGRIEVDVRDIIRPLLLFSLRNVPDPYRQPEIVKTFDVTVQELDANGEPAGDTQTKTFTVIRAGVDSLAETPDNFLQHNFLTWQPNVKPVTYYSPEFLTYYAIDATVIKCKAHLDSSDKDLILAHIAVGECWTVPVQYAIIAGKTNALPLYYDIWAENGAGENGLLIFSAIMQMICGLKMKSGFCLKIRLVVLIRFALTVLVKQRLNTHIILQRSKKLQRNIVSIQLESLRRIRDTWIGKSVYGYSTSFHH